MSDETWGPLDAYFSLLTGTVSDAPKAPAAPTNTEKPKGLKANGTKTSAAADESADLSDIFEDTGKRRAGAASAAKKKARPTVKAKPDESTGGESESGNADGDGTDDSADE